MIDVLAQEETKTSMNLRSRDRIFNAREVDTEVNGRIVLSAIMQIQVSRLVGGGQCAGIGLKRFQRRTSEFPKPRNYNFRYLSLNNIIRTPEHRPPMFNFLWVLSATLILILDN